MPNLAFPNAATPIGSIPYYAIRFSPAEQRNGLAARYSWLHEIDRIISTIKDPGVARLKLDWWHKEWTQALSGSATHPVTKMTLESAFQPFVTSSSERHVSVAQS